jgi:SAM-dependent methyltransferase
MYSKRLLKDAVTIARASITNQIARVAPKTYFRAIHETGRGPTGGSEVELAAYSKKCFEAYVDRLRRGDASESWIRDDFNVLELGPGDFPGVAVLFVAHGAKQVTCVDRFPLLSMSAFNQRALAHLIGELGNSEARRAKQAFKVHGDPESGLNPERIRYIVNPHGHSELRDWADAIVSTAVLEHVDQLQATFEDMHHALRPGGKAVHLVDLRSHRLHRDNPLDFLVWPEPIWQLMFSHKGAPNRARVGEYLRAVECAGLEIDEITPTGRFDPDVVQAVRPHLAPRFALQTDEQLSWQAFWLVCRRSTSAKPAGLEGAS